MGSFNVTMGVGHVDGGDLTDVSAMVDTGAAHSILPASLLAYLNVLPRRQDRYVLADGSEKEYGYGVARISIDSEEWPCPVIFGDEDVYLLGATTLEIFGLMVDPVGERLLPRTYRARPI